MNSLPGAMVGIGAAVVFDMVDAKELVSCTVASGSEYMKGMISFSDHLKLIKLISSFTVVNVFLLNFT